MVEESVRNSADKALPWSFKRSDIPICSALIECRSRPTQHSLGYQSATLAGGSASQTRNFANTKRDCSSTYLLHWGLCNLTATYRHQTQEQHLHHHKLETGCGLAKEILQKIPSFQISLENSAQYRCHGYDDGCSLY